MAAVDPFRPGRPIILQPAPVSRGRGRRSGPRPEMLLGQIPDPFGPVAEADYFERNAERMRYPKFRRLHLFVGSGAIEAGCKTVIGSASNNLACSGPSAVPTPYWPYAAATLTGVSKTTGKHAAPPNLNFCIAHPWPTRRFSGRTYVLPQSWCSVCLSRRSTSVIYRVAGRGPPDQRSLTPPHTSRCPRHPSKSSQFRPARGPRRK
jgi:hypothetical protein